MRLPDFLIIGAMKAGTTTLFRDLEANPDCFFPLDKEPHCLARDEVLSPAGLEHYAAMFDRAAPDQRCGEASTGYTKRPTIEGVAARARRVLGSELKVVYLVREPVSRAISHHYHAWTFDQAGPSVDEEIRRSSVYIDYGRYAWQLEPWLQEFGPEQVLIVRFETYSKRRIETIEHISRFLGIKPVPSLVNPDMVYNKGDRRPMHSGVWSAVHRSWLYRKGLRRFLPRRFKDLAFRAILPRGPERPNPPTLETVDYILDRVGPDCERLRRLMQLPEPVWNLEAVRQKFAQHRNPAS